MSLNLSITPPTINRLHVKSGLVGSRINIPPHQFSGGAPDINATWVLLSWSPVPRKSYPLTIFAWQGTRLNLSLGTWGTPKWGMLRGSNISCDGFTWAYICVWPLTLKWYCVKSFFLCFSGISNLRSCVKSGQVRGQINPLMICTVLRKI